MKKRMLSLLVIMSLIMVSLGGCTSNQKDDKPAAPGKEESSSVSETGDAASVDKEFTYTLTTNPYTIDPTLAYDNNGVLVVYNTFEGLIEMDSVGTPQPAAATSWQVSDDLMEYTFNLREDGKWSDGKPVTAQDFVYAWQRAANPDTASEFGYFMYYLKNGEAINNGEMAPEELGVEALDAYTLKVTLSKPVNYMFHLFAFSTYFPVRADIVEADPERWTLESETFIGNGPYKMEAWKQNETVILVKNENYWDNASVAVKTINLQVISDSSTALSAYEAGQIDGSYAVPSAEIQRILVEIPEFYMSPGLILEYIEFNTEAAPFDDIRVRKAFSLAINRKDITSKITLGGEMPATGIVPYGMMLDGEDFRENGDTYGLSLESADIEQAQKLLAEAGYPNGEGFPEITLNLPSSSIRQREAEGMLEMWKTSLGITSISLLPQEDKVHYTDLGEGNYQFGISSWMADYPHPMSFLDMWITGSGNNNTRFSSTEYDQLIHDSIVSKDETETKTLLHKAEDIWMNEHVVAPLYFSAQAVLVKDYVKGFKFTPTLIVHFKDVDIEK